MLTDHDAFRNLLWFLSGTFINEQDRYRNILNCFKDTNYNQLTKEQMRLIDEVLTDVLGGSNASV